MLTGPSFGLPVVIWIVSKTDDVTFLPLVSVKFLPGRLCHVPFR